MGLLVSYKPLGLTVSFRRLCAEAPCNEDVERDIVHFPAARRRLDARMGASMLPLAPV